MASLALQKAILQLEKTSTALILTKLAIPTRHPKSDEHVIRVHTTAITNGELRWPANFAIPDKYAANKELVPCFDVAGTVVSAPESSPFQKGIEVYARASYLRTGCAREYSILMTDEISKRPNSLTWAESATVPMSAETAWQALFVHAGLTPLADEGAKGKRVFVTAASGGVGSWVVQLAKWAGAEVVGTCNVANLDYVHSLGASEVIDYRKTNIKEWATGKGKKADITIDCIGSKSLEDAWWTVEEGGSLVSIFQPPEQMKPAAFGGSIKHKFFVMESNGEQLAKITELLEAGLARPALDNVFPLEKFQDAFERVDSGKTRGKVVLELFTANTETDS